MIEIYNWIVANQESVKELGQAIVVLYLASIGVASIIVKLTPTLRDDNALKAVIKIVGKYGAWNR